MSDLFSIKGVLYDLECLKLQSIAKESKYPIVNIGTYCGKSTAFLASGTKQKVYAIDLWDERPKRYTPDKFDILHGYHLETTYREFLRNMLQYSLANVVPMKGDSNIIGKTWDKPLGVLFIDGDHHYEQALKDYELFAKHIVVGGYLAIHDIVIKTVKKLIDEVIIPSGLWVEFELVETLWIAKKGNNGNGRRTD